MKKSILTGTEYNSESIDVFTPHKLLVVLWGVLNVCHFSIFNALRISRTATKAKLQQPIIFAILLRLGFLLIFADIPVTYIKLPVIHPKPEPKRQPVSADLKIEIN